VYIKSAETTIEYEIS